MSRPSRWPRLLALPFALWSTIPGVEWCRVGWAEVRLECLASCSIERTACGPDAREGADVCQASCPVEAAGCPASTEASACPSAHPRAGARAPEEFPGGRAYCLAGPTGGDGVPPSPPPPPDPTPMAAVVPAAPLLERLTSGTDRAPVLSRSPPPPAADWASARSRAPPTDPTT